MEFVAGTAESGILAEEKHVPETRLSASDVIQAIVGPTDMRG
jgi:hypothetical protein